MQALLRVSLRNLDQGKAIREIVKTNETPPTEGQKPVVAGQLSRNQGNFRAKVGFWFSIT